MMFTTISPTRVLTSSRTRPGLIPGFSRFSLERPGKTGTIAGEILDQSATRLGAGREKVHNGCKLVNICIEYTIALNKPFSRVLRVLF